MDQTTTAAIIERAVEGARRAFGARAEPGLLDRYARDVALDLWLADPTLTVADAHRALRRPRAAR